MCKEIYEKNENQESSDTLPFHWEFGKEEITLKVSSYACGSCIFDPAGIFRTVSCQDHARYLLVCFYWYFVYCQWQLFSQNPHQSLCRTKVSVAIQ